MSTALGPGPGSARRYRFERPWFRCVIVALLAAANACTSSRAPRPGELAPEASQPVGSLIIRALSNDTVVFDQGDPQLSLVGRESEVIGVVDSLRHQMTRYDGLRPGRYLLKVRRLGYWPERWEIEIRAGCRAVLEIRARPSVLCLDGCGPQPRAPKPYARYDACADGG
jgi:hypothetical protein